MTRSIQVSLPPDKTDRLVSELRSLDGIVGLNLQCGASLKPSGDVLIIDATNNALMDVLGLLNSHNVGEHGTVLTSEPRSLVSPQKQSQSIKNAMRPAGPK